MSIDIQTLTKRTPVVLIDADGVLLEFSEHLLGLVGSDRKSEHVVSWDIFGLIEGWHGSEKRKLAERFCDGNDFWRMQPPMPGALEAVTLLRSHGVRLKCVTSPWHECREWGFIRRARLRELYGIEGSDVVETTDKDLLRGDLFIDDRPKHITQWAKANPNGVACLFDAPYNRRSSTPTFDWQYRVDWRPGLPFLRALLQAL
jgi:5'(3')-deoxyribonucleotidase